MAPFHINMGTPSSQKKSSVCLSGSKYQHLVLILPIVNPGHHHVGIPSSQLRLDEMLLDWYILFWQNYLSSAIFDF
jgi:hypothetical protein